MARLEPRIVRALQNFRLRMDIEDLQNAYRSALKGLLHRQDEIEAMVRQQLDLGPDDEFPTETENDPDDPIARLYEDASEQSSQAKRGAPMVRKAFLIALFHAWERHCNARLKSTTHSSASVNILLVEDGYAHHCELIEHLRLAANCAKHGPGTSGRTLFGVRPDLFPRVDQACVANERTLAITDVTLDQFFEAVLEVSR